MPDDGRKESIEMLTIEMLTIECPLCAGDATTDEALSIVTCAGCGISAEIAPDPAIALQPAA